MYTAMKVLKQCTRTQVQHNPVWEPITYSYICLYKSVGMIWSDTYVLKYNTSYVALLWHRFDIACMWHTFNTLRPPCADTGIHIVLLRLLSNDKSMNHFQCASNFVHVLTLYFSYAVGLTWYLFPIVYKHMRH